MPKFKFSLLPVLLVLQLISVAPAQAEALSLEQTLQQKVLESLIKSTIVAFENPQTREAINQFSELIKDEYTYQYIIQKIDKFILTNELDEYEDHAEALKEALTQMRELYIQSEQQAVDQYQDMKQKQLEREKQRELKANNILEV
jgi:hypothetical protein